jgi:uncharacterized membrane protein
MSKNWLKKALELTPYLITLVITILYTLLALLRHNQFRTYGYDLGIYDQTVWLYSRFIYPFVTVEYKFALLNHFSPSLALFAPLYWIWSDPRMLLMAQTLMIGLSAIPINKLAQKYNLPLYLRSVMVFSYLMFFGYQYAVNYDVHSLVYGAALIPWLIYALENRNKRVVIILFLVIAGMKESFPVMLFTIGVIYFLRGWKRPGLILSAASLTYLLIIMQVFIPIMELLTNEHYRFSSSPPMNPLDLVTQLFDSKNKLEVWKLSSLWFIGFPLFSPLTALASLGDLAFYFVLGNHHKETHTLYNHYRSSLAPLLTWSTLLATINLKKKLKIPYAFQAIALLISCLGLQYYYDLPLNSLLDKKWYQTPQYVIDNREILKKVPANAPITAQNSLVPWITQRKEAHILWAYNGNGGYRKFDPNNSPCNKNQCFWLRFHTKSEYVITDTHPGQNAVTLLMENEDKVKEGLTNMQTAGIISIVAQQGETTLWKIDKKKYKELQ